MITAGEPADIGKAFDYDRWGEWILFSIVFGLMVGVGLVLCIIPGLFLLAFFGLAPFYFIDGNMSLGEALTASREATTSQGPCASPCCFRSSSASLGIIGVSSGCPRHCAHRVRRGRVPLPLRAGPTGRGE